MTFVRSCPVPATLGLLMLVGGCAPPAPTVEADVRVATLGDPLPGLTPAELARFEAGRAAFSRVFLPEEGLGPVFNENSCNACHSDPTIGGSGGEEYDVHATYQAEDGRCDLLDAHGGGNVRTQVTAVAAALGVEREYSPPEANQRGFFTAPPMWGRGLVEAIPDETIVALADPDDRNGDGVSGRVGRDADGNVGRFRRKADVRDLQVIAEGGVLVEFGMTTPSHPAELVFSVERLPDGADPAPDPELDQGTIDAIADFIRFLAPPARSVPGDPAEQARVAAGEQRFFEVGCAACHVPTLRTGPNPVAALDRKEAPLYSDLLLHDMGPERGNVCSPQASPSEFRTEILMGLSSRSVYMYDGKAPTLWEAIALHGGEGAASVRAFNALPELERHALVAFLLTL
jgi:CxxC motif-containing protein (DUF1111 family)